MEELLLRLAMNTITKYEIAKRVAGNTGLSVAYCEDVINKILSNVIEIIKGNHKLHIKNFGSFEVNNKSERPGRDISKNIEVTIPAKRVMKFSASRSLRKKINE